MAVSQLINHLAEIVYQLGDRHSKVSFDEFEDDAIEYYGLHLPLALATYENQLIALKRDGKAFALYDEEYPFLVGIDGLSVEAFMTTYLPRNEKAPYHAKLKRAAIDIAWDFGELYFTHGQAGRRTIEVVFSNGKEEITKSLNLVKRGIWYTEKAMIEEVFRNEMEAKVFDRLSGWLQDSIAYMAIPDMYSFNRTPAFKTHLEQYDRPI